MAINSDFLRASAPLASNRSRGRSLSGSSLIKSPRLIGFTLPISLQMTRKKYFSAFGITLRNVLGLHPAPQDFGHAPGLRDASARRERRLGVENFVDRS